MRPSINVPIIDLFAGPGGLGEGFSRAASANFQIAVSIEKDPMAFETLRLRAAHRALARWSKDDRKVWKQWDAVIANTAWRDVFATLAKSELAPIREACKEAAREVWHIELGPSRRQEVSEGVRKRLGSGRRVPANTVLIGGPPCQAYSLVGRSRNQAIEGYSPETDPRHFLYKEYLQIISEFEPAVFVMENVKGILSSRVSGQRIFHTMIRDLQRPRQACGKSGRLEYVLRPLGAAAGTTTDPGDYVVRSEEFGVPQARHRVIICGIRSDVFERCDGVRRLGHTEPPTVEEAIGDLPHLRSELSFRGRGRHWADVFSSPVLTDAIAALKGQSAESREVADVMAAAARAAVKNASLGVGGERTPLRPSDGAPVVLNQWYRDRPLDVLANHAARSHMPSDILRYLFVAAFGLQVRRSPRLADFPRDLLPEHLNIDREAVGAAIFNDRFRVQRKDTFSTTVTSHIAKDGHAFVHYDPAQCRSLTVREAARLQTFPDSYVFLGNRTSQYTQVGNAVPPYLASQIADVVGDILRRAGLAS